MFTFYFAVFTVAVIKCNIIIVTHPLMFRYMSISRLDLISPTLELTVSLLYPFLLLCLGSLLCWNYYVHVSAIELWFEEKLKNMDVPLRLYYAIHFVPVPLTAKQPQSMMPPPCLTFGVLRFAKPRLLQDGLSHWGKTFFRRHVAPGHGRRDVSWVVPEHPNLVTLIWERQLPWQSGYTSE